MKNRKKERPEKLPDVDLLEMIKKLISEGKYRQSIHALDRLVERDIDLLDALYVLKKGYHEKRKTTFDEVFQQWKYAIRGRTLENDELRVIVAVKENGVLIITAIDLNKE